MIWFGPAVRELLPPPRPGVVPPDANTRMARALRAVAERAPHLAGDALADALAETGWVDRATVARLLPHFRHFDADRCFAEGLRALSFKGQGAADEFRLRLLRLFGDLTGDAHPGRVGPEEAIRFRLGEREGIVLAHPRVAFTVSGATAEAVRAAVDEMPDALVIVARNFRPGADETVHGLLHRTEVPGTLVTVNLLLGMRAAALRYRPAPDRLAALLGAGRALRSRDLAALGERERSAA